MPGDATPRLEAFARRLSWLENTFVRSIAADPNGGAAIVLELTGGTRLRADFWRLIADGTAHLSSFDHAQRYGLPAPIDAIDELAGMLPGKLVTHARIDGRTGDLSFAFSGNVELQVFNFTGYEAWAMTFADGAGELSNHILRD
jgi:hypothetical protein